MAGASGCAMASAWFWGPSVQLWAVGGSADRCAVLLGAIGGDCGRPRLAVGVRWTKRNAIRSDRWGRAHISTPGPRGAWGGEVKCGGRFFLTYWHCFLFFSNDYQIVTKNIDKAFAAFPIRFSCKYAIICPPKHAF